MTTSTTTSPAMHSAIYSGWVRHRRYSPHAHAFRYRMFMMFVDLSELPRIFRGRWLWSLERRNLGQFRRSDYHGDPAVPLDQAVRDTVEKLGGERPLGPIRLLTHLRYFGYCFNPVSFYYCYAEGGSQLQCILAEITNTPWHERHCYLLPIDGAESHGSVLVWRFDKTFHVSPFVPMQRVYDWRFQPPDENLRVHMDVLNADLPELDTTLVLTRHALNGWSLARCLLVYPLLTFRIVVAIHWQAFLIWCRRNPVYDHPAGSHGD
ncbi:MAG: DUF1365 domain-containing protein [Pseudomarimonas sp.]